MISFSKTFFVVCMMLFASQIHAQRGIEDGSKYGHGEDSIECLKNLSLYRTYAKQKAYEDALPYWRFVVHNCPYSSKNIFIDGPKIYNHLIDKAENEEDKQRYVDSLMKVYDLRIKYYPKRKGYVLGRKGVDLFKHRSQNPEAMEKVYEILSESLEIMGVKSSPAVLIALMNTACFLYEEDKLEKGEVIEVFSETDKLAGQMLENKPDNRFLKSAKEDINEVFIKYDVADCQSLDELFGPKLEANPEDIDLLRNIYELFSSNSCTGSEIYYEAFENLLQQDSSAAKFNEFASLAKENGDYKKAVKYLKKAINMDDDDEKKASYYIKLADITLRYLEDNPRARKYAKKAADLNEESGKPYLIIGNIYASTDDCTSEKLNKKAVYWLAVDYFKKAKEVDSSLAEKADKNIETYRQYFPDKEEIFFNGLDIGESYKIECWINESTTVRTK